VATKWLPSFWTQSTLVWFVAFFFYMVILGFFFLSGYFGFASLGDKEGLVLSRYIHDLRNGDFDYGCTGVCTYDLSMKTWPRGMRSCSGLQRNFRINSHHRRWGDHAKLAQPNIELFKASLVEVSAALKLFSLSNRCFEISHKNYQKTQSKCRSAFGCLLYLYAVVPFTFYLF
jgi:hypothetical protein